MLLNIYSTMLLAALWVVPTKIIPSFGLKMTNSAWEAGEKQKKKKSIRKTFWFLVLFVPQLSSILRLYEVNCPTQAIKKFQNAYGF